MNIFRGLCITALILLACLDHSNAAQEHGWFGGIFGDHHGSSMDRIHGGLTHVKEGVVSGTKKVLGGLHEMVAKTWHGTTHVLGGIFSGLQEMIGMKPKTTTDKMIDDAKYHGDRLASGLHRKVDRTQHRMHDTLNEVRDTFNDVRSSVRNGARKLSRRLSGDSGHRNYGEAY